MHWFVFVKKCSFATIFRPQYIEELLHFLKLFIDNKSESLLLLVCVCDALWEAEAPPIYWHKDQPQNVTSALERDK